MKSSRNKEKIQLLDQLVFTLGSFMTRPSLSKESEDMTSFNNIWIKSNISKTTSIKTFITDRLLINSSLLEELPKLLLMPNIIQVNSLTQQLMTQKRLTQLPGPP